MAIATPALVEPTPTSPDASVSDSSGTPAAVRRVTPKPHSPRLRVPGRARVVATTITVAALGLLVMLLGATWALAAAGDIRVSEGIS